MAVQYDVAFSASTVGAGIVAGGPYNCVFVNIGGIGACMAAMPLPPSGMASVAAAEGFADLGEIDPISHLASQKFYLFSGKNDTVVKQSVMNAVDTFYLDAGVPASRIKYVKTFPAGHAFIAPDFGNLCGTNDNPYVDRCEFPRHTLRSTRRNPQSDLRPTATKGGNIVRATRRLQPTGICQQRLRHG